MRAGTLVARVERGEIDEVILATSPTLEGEATANWLASALRGFPVRITRIATESPPAATSNTPTKSPWPRPRRQKRSLCPDSKFVSQIEWSSPEELHRPRNHPCIEHGAVAQIR